MLPYVRAFGLVVLVLGLVACGPAAKGHEATCHVEGPQGVCEGRFESIRGAYVHAVEAPEIAPGQAVEVELQIAVDRGTLRAAFASPTGEESACEARQDVPERVLGLATMSDGGRLPVTLEALQGKALGVTYMIAWAAAP